MIQVVTVAALILHNALFLIFLFVVLLQSNVVDVLLTLIVLTTPMEIYVKGIKLKLYLGVSGKCSCSYNSDCQLNSTQPFCSSS